MIVLPGVAGKTVLVLGLGKTGLAAVRALIEAQAHVGVWDDNEATRKTQALPQLAEWQEPMAALEHSCDFILCSPGISPAHPALIKAKEKGIPVLTDLDLLRSRYPQNDILGVTGTNGKSTTTALLGHVLSQFFDTRTGGNIGLPVLAFEPPRSTESKFVLELSSYQLSQVQLLAVKGGIHLNLTPDHLERHGSMRAYAQAKLRLFEGSRGVAVIGVDDEESRWMAQQLKAAQYIRVIEVSLESNLSDGVVVRDAKVYGVQNGQETLWGDLANCRTLRGTHNHQNAACVLALLNAVYGLSPEQCWPFFESFAGLPHRQFEVATIDGITFINDSKATNADATAKAMAVFDDMYWIVGGRPKTTGLEGLQSFLPRVRKAFLIGEAAEDFAAWLQPKGVAFTHCRTLENAVKTAFEAALSDNVAGTVLLSPACASFDQFTSFEHRGDVFTDLVRRLRQERLAA